MNDRQTKTAVQTAAEDSRATEQQHKIILSDLLRVLHEEEMHYYILWLVRPFDLTTTEALESILNCYPEMSKNAYSYDDDVIIFEIEKVPDLYKDFCREIGKHFAAYIDWITLDLTISHNWTYVDEEEISKT